MLRSSPDTLTLRVRPDAYAIVSSLRGGEWMSWPAQIAGRDLEARIAQLELPKEGRHARLDVVLDSALTRMQVVCFPAGVRKPEERSNYLKASFRNVFGQEAGNWHIVAEPSYFHEPVPAVAVDRPLIQAVTALCERHELKLRSLRTSFIDSFNLMRGKLTAHAGAFAMLEGERLCIGLWHKRTWLALSMQAIARGDGAALAAALAQLLARVTTPMPVGTLYLVSDETPFKIPLAEGWAVEWLKPGAR